MGCGRVGRVKWDCRMREKRVEGGWMWCGGRAIDRGGAWGVEIAVKCQQRTNLRFGPLCTTF